MKYLLGVDGGNTKTDYFLFDQNLTFVDHLRRGTCSHEALLDSFDGTKRELTEALQLLFERNNITVHDISAAVFGLAGLDTNYQFQRLSEIIAQLGFKNFKAVNDSFLGIKAGTSRGVGVCSINGTGTSSGGIDSNGDVLQVGGIGPTTSDYAGGRFISRQVVAAAYNETYRCGPKTSLTPIVFEKLGMTDPRDFIDKISYTFISRNFDYHALVLACFDEARKGDQVAQKILHTIAETLAHSACGIIRNMEFKNTPEIVLAGSVWVKGDYPNFIPHFTKTATLLLGQEPIVTALQVPPASGAIIWAYELATKEFPNQAIRKQIIEEVEAHLE